MCFFTLPSAGLSTAPYGLLSRCWVLVDLPTLVRMGEGQLLQWSHSDEGEGERESSELVEQEGFQRGVIF